MIHKIVFTASLFAVLVLQTDSFASRDNSLLAGPLMSLAPKGLLFSFVIDKRHEGWLELCDSNKSCRVHKSDRAKKHTFLFDTLQDGKQYRYRVGSKNHTSKWYNFKTPNRSSKELSFLVLGDIQDSKPNMKTRKILSKLLRDHHDVDIVVSPGDLVNISFQRYWRVFFNEFRELLATKPFMPVAGNHDTPWPMSNKNLSAFKYYFTDDKSVVKAPHYTFDIGPATFIALNTEIKSELTRDGKQYKFTKEALTNSDSLWKFAYFHISPVNFGVRHEDQQKYTRDTATLFNKKLDWFFGGHEHLYQRFHPLSVVAGKLKQENSFKNGTGYINIPSMGQTPGDEVLNSELARQLVAFPGTGENLKTGNGFTRADISGRNISIKTYFFNSSEELELVDQVNYKK